MDCAKGIAFLGGKEARKDMPGPPMGGRERRGTPPPPPGGRGGFGGPPRF